MFQKLKDKAAEKLIEKQMADMPPEQRDMILGMMKENPELFKNMEKDMKELVKSGKSQMAAAMEIQRKYQSEMAKLQKMMIKK